jgi:Na+-translocating ferredoxin:NAD+ oxidoreductase RnfD subunit
MSASFAGPGEGLIGNLLTWNVDSLTSATPLAAAKQGETTSFVYMLLGNISGSAGETSAILIILGGVFLLLTRVANWRSVVSILGSFAVLSGILMARGIVSEPMPTVFGSVLWHIFAGGLLFGTFFMATDPVTSPTTNAGKWFYGITIGSITVLIRHFTGYMEGVTFAILLGNIVAPVLDEIVIGLRIRRLNSEG